MIKNKKILVIGKSSFIAEHLIEHFSEYNSVNVINHDVLIQNRYDIIINVACPASPDGNSLDILNACSDLVRYLLDICKKDKSMFIQLSSGEADILRCHAHPHRAYGSGKRFAETLCYEYYKQFGVDARIVRLYNTYGKGMNLTYKRSQSTFINDALNNNQINVDGEANHIRTYTHIDDTVSGIEAVIEKGKAGEVYEIANETPIRIKEFADMAGKVSGKLVIHSCKNFKPDTILPDANCVAKLKALGWEAKIGLEEGLRKTICD